MGDRFTIRHGFRIGVLASLLSAVGMGWYTRRFEPACSQANRFYYDTRRRSTKRS